MKKQLFALAAILPLALIAACSSPTSAEQAQSPTPSTTTTITPTPSPSATKAVPDAVGLTVEQAKQAIEQWGFETTVEHDVDPSIASKTEVKKHLKDFVVYDQEEVFSMTGKPEVVLKVTPNDEFEDKYMAFAFSCSDGGYGSDSIKSSFYSLQSIWDSKDYESFTECYAATDDDYEWKPTKEQARIAKIANKHWEGDEEPVNAYIAALEHCAVPQPSEEDWASAAAISKPWLEAASELCKDAPFYDELKSWANGGKFGDGKYEVGSEMEPGTYKSSKKVSDCYWERMTPNGGTIANDFISYAAAGAVVTVRKGEVFEASEECGIWTRQ